MAKAMRQGSEDRDFRRPKGLFALTSGAAPRASAPDIASQRGWAGGRIQTFAVLSGSATGGFLRWARARKSMGCRSKLPMAVLEEDGSAFAKALPVVANPAKSPPRVPGQPDDSSADRALAPLPGVETSEAR